MFKRVVMLCNNVSSVISGWIVMFVTLFITMDVVLRYLFKASIPASVEITQVLLVILVYLSLAKAQEGKQHIRVEYLIQKMPSRMKRWWEFVIHLAAFIFVSIVLWVSIPYFIRSVSVGEYYAGAARIPIYPARAVILIGCAFFIMQLFKDLVDLISPKRKFTETPSPEVREIQEAIQKIEEQQAEK